MDVKRARGEPRSLVGSVLRIRSRGDGDLYQCSEKSSNYIIQQYTDESVGLIFLTSLCPC